MDQKSYLGKVDGSAQKPRDKHLSRNRQPFWGPPAVIQTFAEGVMCDVAGGEQVPSVPLGWYLVNYY